MIAQAYQVISERKKHRRGVTDRVFVEMRSYYQRDCKFGFEEYALMKDVETTLQLSHYKREQLLRFHLDRQEIYKLFIYVQI